MCRRKRIRQRTNKYFYIKKFFPEHEDGRRGGEIARTVLWNSKFYIYQQ